MISEKSLRAELRRYPGFIKRALKEKDYREVIECVVQMETIEWILSDEN